MRLFTKNKYQIDYKSVAISVMYLDRSKADLEKRVEEQKAVGKDPWIAEYDIKCIDNAIKLLEQEKR